MADLILFFITLAVYRHRLLTVPRLTIHGTSVMINDVVVVVGGGGGVSQCPQMSGCQGQ